MHALVKSRVLWRGGGETLPLLSTGATKINTKWMSLVVALSAVARWQGSRAARQCWPKLNKQFFSTDTFVSLIHVCSTVWQSLACFEQCRWWQTDTCFPLGAYRRCMHLLLRFSTLSLLSRHHFWQQHVAVFSKKTLKTHYTLCAQHQTVGVGRDQKQN